MALSGDTLPQVSEGGFVEGTLHIVTSDGAGPYTALLDTSGTGNFANAQKMAVLTQVPGTRGNIRKSSARAWIRALENLGLVKRATNINEDFVSVFISRDGADGMLMWFHGDSRSRLLCPRVRLVRVLLLVRVMFAWSSL